MTEPNPPINELKRVLLGDVLDEASAEALMTAIMKGEASPAQVGAVLGAYRLRPPLVGELAGFAKAMREHCTQVQSDRKPLVDTAGTGGAIVKSFNVSTTAGFIIAGTGVPVAKHGNRSVTSPSGSADVLEALGSKLEQGPEAVVKLLDDVGFAFLYAPAFHPAMKHAIVPRRELGVPTIFNILGPLTNPARPSHQLIGVGRPDLVPIIAETMGLVGIDGAVVHGAPGLDEVSIVGPTTVAYVHDGEVSTGHVTPRDLGVKSADVSDIAGLPPTDAAKAMREMLAGEIAGPRTEMVLASAGLALHAAGVADSPEAGVERARSVLADGSALKVMERFVEATRG